MPSPAYGSAPPAYGTPLQYGPPVVPSHRRRNAAIALGAVAVLVAVIVVLSVALPHGGSGAANVFGTPVPYSATVSPISTADAAVPGGPWTPVVVFGLGLPSSLTGSISNGGLGDDSCSPIWTGAETLATFPATVWGSEPGDVASWTVFSSNGDGDVLFSAASEISGTTVQADAYEVEAGSCLTGFSSFTAVTASPVDSTTAASAAGPNGGSSFLAANSGATIELLLTGDVWAIVYTTCGFDATSGTGSAFIGEVNATTGAWVDGGTMPEDC